MASGDWPRTAYAQSITFMFMFIGFKSSLCVCRHFRFRFLFVDSLLVVVVFFGKFYLLASCTFVIGNYVRSRIDRIVFMHVQKISFVLQ